MSLFYAAPVPAIVETDAEQADRLSNRAATHLPIMIGSPPLSGYWNCNCGDFYAPTRELVLDHPVNQALIEHQRSCSVCTDVRNWIMNEQLSGRIKGPDDVARVGQYVVDHSCETGTLLQKRLGEAMVQGIKQ